GDYLVGPGAKQRYIDAKTIVDHIRQTHLPEADRVKLTKDLVDVLERYTHPNEGEVQHVLLLALGQVWLRNDATSPQADAARKLALDTLLKFADAQEVATRKAAALGLAYS